jgi:hypothetical protein
VLTTPRIQAHVAALEAGGLSASRRSGGRSSLRSIAAALNGRPAGSPVERGGSTNDPVNAPAPETHGVAELTREQAADVRPAALDAREVDGSEAA